MPTLTAGSTITVREVWAGAVWLHFPEVVVADDAATGVLATLQRDGTPLTFPPEHPGGPHPWSHQTHWQGTTVLKLRRPGEWYSVWKFFDAAGAGAFQGWYVNFERPYVRRAGPDGGIDVDDLELDLVIRPDGGRQWKDVEHLHANLEAGRFALDDLLRVLGAAPDVVDLLDRDDRWWAPYDDWTPSDVPRPAP